MRIPQAMGALDGVLDEVVQLFQGAPNWASPLTMCNVTPQANTAGLIASMLAQVFAANILEGECAWNVHRAELETAGRENVILKDALSHDEIFYVIL